MVDMKIEQMSEYKEMMLKLERNESKGELKGATKTVID